MKHIVLDVRLIETSTGRYMQRLVEGVNDNFVATDDYKYTALVPSQHVDKWQRRLPHIDIVAADQKWYTFSEQWSLYWQLRQLKPDLVHFTMPQQPLLYGGKSITTIHDVTLIRFDNLRPGQSKFVYWSRKKIFLGLMHIVIRRSEAVITPTEFVRQDLANYFGKRFTNKIHTTLLAGEIPDVSPEPIDRFSNTPYLFFVGNPFPYKNVWRIVDAFAIIKKKYPDLQLLLAGKKNEFYQDIERRIQQKGIKDVHFLGFVTDGEKRWLLQNAQIFITASYSEGFCMPILEAMIEGTAVASSNASCLPEVVGDGGVLFDPSSTEDLIDKITPILDNPDHRQSLIKKGYKHASSFSWQRMIEQTLKIYERTLK